MSTTMPDMTMPSSASASSTISSTINQNEQPEPLQMKIQIALHSSDDKIFYISYEEGQVSKLVQNTMENNINNDAAEEEEAEADNSSDNNETTTTNNNNNNNVILLPKVDSQTLAQIVQFMKYHATDPLHPISSPFKSRSMCDVITQDWYIQFMSSMDGDQHTLYKLINGANYMDIEPLLNLGCLAVSAMMMDKSAEEIRVLLNIEKMTDEEELRAREEHSWMF